MSFIKNKTTPYHPFARVFHRNSIIIKHIIYNFILSKLRITPPSIRSCGANLRRLSSENNADYIKSVFNDYLLYGNLKKTDFINKTVLEIGYGDNIGVGLHFVACGAKKVICIDRYFPASNTKREKEVYQKIHQDLSPLEKSRLTRQFVSSNFSQLPPQLKVIPGLSIENAHILKTKFDFIISNSVLQYSFDLTQAFNTMNQLLNPGGVMIHRIDFRDTIFRKKNLHPLEYLTLPDNLYKQMTSHNLKSNRKLLPNYIYHLNNLHYSHSYLVTHIIGSSVHPYIKNPVYQVHYHSNTVACLKHIRPQLITRYKKLSDKYLMIQGAIIRAKKPRR